MDKSTKRNIVKNMERKIKKMTMEEENKVKLEERLWENLRKNGYRKQKEKEDGKKREETGKDGVGRRLKEDYID